MQDGNWLVDPARRGAVARDDAELGASDKRALRELGQRLATYAALPVQDAKADMWRALNGLRQVKPMVWIDEIPWHEMGVDDELTLRTTTEWSRYHEWELRKLIYQWEHMPADMVVEPAVYSPLVVYNTAFGIAEDVDIAVTDEANSIVSRHFNIQIRDEDDLEKIKVPVVTHDRPEFVHKAIDRLVNAYLSMLDQFEDQDLLRLNNTYYRIGSGGLGYTDELPAPDYDPRHVRAKDLWGSGAAQIFSDVSPRMHWEFAMQYEVRWLSRFGLNYYGCCDPLHRKMGILEKIPNLRKVSMSPWVDIDQAVANVGNRYVFSYKPNPAVFAEKTWHLDKARDELEMVLTKAKAHGCVVEVIMKDISTLRYEPHRLWEWAAMAAEVTRCYGE